MAGTVNIYKSQTRSTKTGSSIQIHFKKCQINKKLTTLYLQVRNNHPIVQYYSNWATWKKCTSKYM